MNSEVEQYFSEAKKWKEEMQQLRLLVLDCGLTEELKWRVPCYTFEHNNILMIGAFKANCTLSFFKGVLLKDDNNILAKPGENSQAVRLVRFTDVREIVKMKSILKAYIKEAIEIEKAGLKVDFKKKTELVFSEELQQKLDSDLAFKTAFEGLTLGRQRGYHLYFSATKQSKTRESRIEKCMPKILAGKGLNDCTCGLSKRLPTCDGSHKYI